MSTTPKRIRVKGHLYTLAGDPPRAPSLKDLPVKTPEKIKFCGATYRKVASDFIPLKDIPLNSVWMAASELPFGVVVVDKDFKREDVIVRRFVLGDDGEKVFDEGTYPLDWYKLQYRYYQP